MLRRCSFRLRIWFVLVGGCGAVWLAGVQTACRSTAPSGANHVDELRSTPSETGWTHLVLGLCEDYPEESRSAAAAEADLAAVRASGAKVLRIAFGWDAMEPARGVYDWTFWDDFVRKAVEHHGITLIPYLCYTPDWAAREPGPNAWRSPPRDPEDFGRFAAVLARRYGKWIRTWELWNEPDNPAYWTGTRFELAQLVKAGSRHLREVEPQLRVVLGGIAWNVDYLEDLFAEHGLAPYVDVVNVHSYYETWHADRIETLPRYLAEAREVVRRYGENEPLWLAETGYSSVGARLGTSDAYRIRFADEHTREAQAHALLRTCILALATTEIELLAWYRLNDLPSAQEVIGDDNNLHLGLLDTTRIPKPAWSAFQTVTQLFGAGYRVTPARHQVLGPVDDARVLHHAFELSDGREVHVVWRDPSSTHGLNPLGLSLQLESLPGRSPRTVQRHVFSPAHAVRSTAAEEALASRSVPVVIEGRELHLLIVSPRPST